MRYKFIGLLGLGRSGGNLILSRFHYHPEFFALSERIKLDYKNLDLMASKASMYGNKCCKCIKNIKLEDANKINYIIYRAFYKDSKEQIVENLKGESFKYIVHIRNPIRVYLSQKRFDNLHKRTNNRNFKKILKETISLIEDARLYNGIAPDKLKIFSYEYFLKNFDDNIVDLYNFIDPKLIPYTQYDAP